MNYTEDFDFEAMQGIDADACRTAKINIAEFLGEQNSFAKLDSVINGLWTDTLSKSDKNELYVLLTAIDVLRDELRAWARS